MPWIVIALIVTLIIGLTVWFVGAWYVRGADLSLFDNVGRDQPQDAACAPRRMTNTVP
jgi:hypothetical protein